MTITIHPAGERTEIRIDGALTVMEAAEARDQLALGLSAAAGQVTVSLAEISEIDTAGLQLLLALARQPATVKLVGPSPAVADRIDRLGLRAALHLQEEQHGS